MSGMGMIYRYRGRDTRLKRETYGIAWLLAAALMLMIFGAAIIVLALAWSVR